MLDVSHKNLDNVWMLSPISVEFAQSEKSESALEY